MQESAKRATEVAKLKSKLSFNKDKASFCDQLKCGVKLHKDELFQTQAHERKMMLKMETMVDGEVHWPNFYLKCDKDLFLKVMNIFEELESLGII